MAQRYLDPSEHHPQCSFRLVSLVRRHCGRKTTTFMAVAIDDNMETLRFFQENVQEVIHNVKRMKELEANERHTAHAKRGLQE
ncbi:hypothetical protein [Geobacter sp. DSM 9736]|uniref:hypothetical protein n=1 Tax=Geobacter sp. DSM 9736 TaxID=1277350 RepID=UPI000B60F811|nr:hypothetical protein [Geobacter sp. DSM 9736]SNB46098.1 hypothetical protein SAMN06269301_1538 [Geobacter sp. DSM 9736]